MEKLMITAAVCGAAPMKTQNPKVPYTPEEIAAEALRCWRAGAVIAHVHVRDPQSGEPAFERHLFAEVVSRIRAESDLLINLTTSGFNIREEDVNSARLMPLEFKPDLCSLDVGSLNFRGGRVFINTEQWVERAAGHIRQAKHLASKGAFAPPPYFQLCLGIPWGIEGTIDSLMDMQKRLPEGSQWAALGVGASQLPINTTTILLGGHVRVGFEDNIYWSKGVLADSNAVFVERTVELAKILQREVATCSEARGILGLAHK
jgi:3-keto-5-aminohexanoate cleavage enzyme